MARLSVMSRPRIFFGSLLSINLSQEEEWGLSLYILLPKGSLAMTSATLFSCLKTREIRILDIHCKSFIIVLSAFQSVTTPFNRESTSNRQPPSYTSSWMILCIASCIPCNNVRASTWTTECTLTLPWYNRMGRPSPSLMTPPMQAVPSWYVTSKLIEVELVMYRSSPSPPNAQPVGAFRCNAEVGKDQNLSATISNGWWKQIRLRDQIRVHLSNDFPQL